ncbi:MAG: hypothetical protein OZ921_07650 [Sorangiineae bacterium]|nr:hypothetical protein [Polyangiaceae bacterium]MEB2322371.1 hypothetical protein [Sorangiineae bacterium]
MSFARFTGEGHYARASRRTNNPSPVAIAFTGDGDRELGRPREVGLRRFTRPVLLREDDLLVRAPRGAPHLDPTLQRPQLPRLVPAWVLLDEQLEERLGFERRSLGEPRLDLRPVLVERIFPRPPVPLLGQLRR